MPAQRKQKYRQVVRAVLSAPWAILPDRLAAIGELIELRAAGSRLTRSEVQARIRGADGQARDAHRGLSFQALGPGGGGGANGGQVQPQRIAVLPVYGVLSHRMNLMQQISGGSSYQQLSQWFGEALADESVVAIVLDVDSPGGHVPGVYELAEQMHAARGQKRVIAVANTLAASGAYWLASQADEIVASPSSRLGSIGVVTLHNDYSAADAEAGIKRTLISSPEGGYKAEGNPYEPLSDEARARTQAQGDAIYARFVADVARGRGVSEATVRGAVFGRGRVLDADEAVAAGMADRIGTFSSVLEELVAEFSEPAQGNAQNHSQHSQEKSRNRAQAHDALARHFTQGGVRAMDKQILQALVSMGLLGADASEAAAQGALAIFYAGRGTPIPMANGQVDAAAVLKDLAAKPAPVTPTQHAPTQSSAAADILAAVRISSIPAAEQAQFAGELIAANLDVSTAIGRIQQRAASHSPPSGATRITHTESERDKFRATARDAILVRQWGGSLPQQITLDRHSDAQDWRPSRRDYALASLPRLAEECLVMQGLDRARVSQLPKWELAQAAMGVLSEGTMRGLGFSASSDGPAYNTSGMFANIFLDATNVVLRRAYMEANTTFQLWARQGESVQDFKAVNKVILGEVGDPKAVPEDGEFEESTASDAKEAYKLTVWGHIFSLTWQMVVNDQLGAFLSIAQRQGNAMRRKQNKLVYGVLKDNPTMNDTGALFNSTAETTAGGHNNLDGAAAAVSVATLNLAYTRMAQHMGLNTAEETFLGITPKYLLHPPAIRGTVHSVLRSVADPAGTHAGAANIWQGALIPVTDAQLGSAASGGSNTAWFLAADPNEVDTIEYAYLQGLENPALDQERAFNSLALRYRCYQAFATAAIDWRGLDKNPGA